MLAALLNGNLIAPHDAAIHMDDRGLLYGDGLFETMLLCKGRARFLDDHMQRLFAGMVRLKMNAPDAEVLRNELQRLVQGHDRGVVKLIVTRGCSGRGYRASSGHECTRLWQLFAPVTTDNAGVTVQWCATRYARNALLAGLKHLNRLEQVLAQSEWQDAGIAEGLVMDTEGELISGTMSNVFMIIDGIMVTPDLRYCGVSGVMRKNVLRVARRLNLEIEERAVRPEELQSASEAFITNAVRGVRPVIAVLNATGDTLRWPAGAITTRVMNELNESNELGVAG
ncbi:MAG TPA: aminodeoxychorismate lyase [Steroidobacteraceae bacterium]|nr:aminodeoxychorismate lyase [Steroidobacteraceae bacterium]